MITSKILSKGLLLLVTIILFFLIASPSFAYDASTIKKPNLGVPIPGLNLQESSDFEIDYVFSENYSERYVIIPWINQYINGLYQFLLAIAGIVAVAVIMAGGVIYAAAGGNPNRISLGQDLIISAITGLVLLFLVYTILYLISPQIVQDEGIKVVIPSTVENEADIAKKIEVFNLCNKKATKAECKECMTTTVNAYLQIACFKMTGDELKYCESTLPKKTAELPGIWTQLCERDDLYPEVEPKSKAEKVAAITIGISEGCAGCVLGTNWPAFPKYCNQPKSFFYNVPLAINTIFNIKTISAAEDESISSRCSTDCTQDELDAMFATCSSCLDDCSASQGFDEDFCFDLCVAADDCVDLAEQPDECTECIDEFVDLGFTRSESQHTCEDLGDCMSAVLDELFDCEDCITECQTENPNQTEAACREDCTFYGECAQDECQTCINEESDKGTTLPHETCVYLGYCDDYTEDQSLSKSFASCDDCLGDETTSQIYCSDLFRYETDENKRCSTEFDASTCQQMVYDLFNVQPGDKCYDTFGDTYDTSCVNTELNLIKDYGQCDASTIDTASKKFSDCSSCLWSCSRSDNTCIDSCLDQYNDFCPDTYTIKTCDECIANCNTNQCKQNCYSNYNESTCSIEPESYQGCVIFCGDNPSQTCAEACCNLYPDGCKEVE